jgi:hypothetical protein
MITLEINGSKCQFKNFNVNHANFLKGGTLAYPCIMSVGDYLLKFRELYLFVDNDCISSGTLAEADVIKIGGNFFPVK